MRAMSASEPDRRAVTDAELHPLIADRWSPVGFRPEPLSAEDRDALFEAARWAASCFNEQPWRFVVGERGTPRFDEVLGCMAESNQAWAKDASLVMITVVRSTFTRNGKPNRFAGHDLGLAMGNLSLEATARDLFVHHMGGFSVDEARRRFSIPDGFEPMTAVAIGRLADPAGLDPALAASDAKPRERKPRAELLWDGGDWV
jgi:nitroreductase